LPWQVYAWIAIVPEGKGIIQRVTSPLTSPEGLNRHFLLLDGKPLAALDQTCPTCSGILQTGYAGKADVDRWLGDIRQAVKDVSTFPESRDAFLPIIALFGQGVYSVGMIPYTLTSPDGCRSIEGYGLRRDPSGLAIGNGPYGPHYLEALQPASTIDPSAVGDYVQQISDGKRPFGIAYWIGGFLSLLLDGHHKALAYEHHGLPMPCLTIQRMCPVMSPSQTWWMDCGSRDWGDESRAARAEELPNSLAGLPSSGPEAVDEEQARGYLRVLGISE
jgi:hypothetical protein